MNRFNQDSQNTFKNIQGLILDMDGVLWRQNQPIGNLPALFDQIRGLNLRHVLATNNSTLTPDQYTQKLERFGVQIEPWQVLTSAVAAGMYLHQCYPQGGKVYIIGEAGLQQALESYGFEHSDGQHTLAVVVGLDRNCDYNKLKKATLLVRAGAALIGTNPDRTFPTPEGLVPGAGALIAALEAATEVKACIVGKPEPEMYRGALHRLGTTPEETLVVGDRLETDIAGAQALGCRTALVLSGVTQAEAVYAWSPEPDLILPDLSAVLSYLTQSKFPD
ncbi:MAG: HAD-IIA family hydrolase [Chloroflexota bacterium]